MKLPKKVIIASKEYVVKVDPNSIEGNFTGETNTITVGTRYPHLIEELFIHEVTEAILNERGHRYTAYIEPCGRALFIFNHAEFENIVRDLVLALKDVIYPAKQ